MTQHVITVIALVENGLLLFFVLCLQEAVVVGPLGREGERDDHKGRHAENEQGVDDYIRLDRSLVPLVCLHII